MTVKLLTEYYLEFLSLKGGCTGSSESTLVKMPRCWKSHVEAQLYLGLIVTKPVFRVFDEDPKMTCSVSETVYIFEMFNKAGLEIMLFNQRITKELVRMHRCAGWSGPLLFVYISEVFWGRGPSQGEWS